MDLADVPPVAGVTHRFVDAGGVRLHVAEAGEGPPLLLLHGWPQHWWCWRHVIPTLSRRFRVMAVDLRGWGWSDAPPGAYAKQDLADDIVALLDAEQLVRVSVLGHDWGAYVAFLLALGHPARFARMVALDIVPPWPSAARVSPAVAPVLAYQVTVATPVLGARAMTVSNHFVRSIIRFGSGSTASWSDSELDVYAEVLRDPRRARASSACYRTFLTREVRARPDGRARVERLDVPVRLIMGSASVLRSVRAPEPVDGLEVVEIDGAGHFLPEEAPVQVVEHALSFLQS